MHDQQNYFNTNIYNEFIQRQSYVDGTQNNHTLIIFEPTSTNSLESQSQNQPSHFEISDDEEGDDKETMDTHEMCKKSDLFKVNMKRFKKFDLFEPSVQTEIMAP